MSLEITNHMRENSRRSFSLKAIKKWLCGVLAGGTIKLVVLLGKHAALKAAINCKSF